jgi:hypothetical protein
VRVRRTTQEAMDLFARARHAIERELVEAPGTDERARDEAAARGRTSELAAATAAATTPRDKVRALLAEMLAAPGWGEKANEQAEQHKLRALHECVLDAASREALKQLPKRMCAYEFKPGDIAWNCKVCQVRESAVSFQGKPTEWWTHGGGDVDAIGGRDVRHVQRLLHLERPRGPRGLLLLHSQRRLLRLRRHGGLGTRGLLHKAQGAQRRL